MNPLTKQAVAGLRNQLIEDRQRIEQKLIDNEHYGLGDSQRVLTGELSPIDNHPGDLATETYERGKDIALLEQDELHLARIDEALEAMNKGEYGLCRSCGNPIPLERLQALPETLYCVEHSPQRDESHHRSVEEEFLNPPFGRSSLDEQSSYAGFDGEDAWQIVESWGNSNTPALAEDTDIEYEKFMIEADENEGFVEPIESFLATDITGTHVSVVRSRKYRQYLESGEGDPLLEAGTNEED
ncbi:molecular chaperone DnaK [Paenibacillus sambharensis]|uniref:Molecular chaperone DnaK n=1 Tax=Paenibacillus sambharensis TaxID=1803190 RepID=A0A2W1LFR6_9BACL|nr:TraR/DksA C4-type zinc finger protein [Paenibacillus sambharensis]PZD93872.1 molecular chaperone DnaK [Paenibacillus sambharensis]